MIFRDLDALKTEIDVHKRNGLKIVWTNGCFDIIHPGHIETFKKSKELGNILIVGVNGDRSVYFATKPGRPINDENFRAIMLDSLKYIDYVYIFDDETPLSPISGLLPDVLLKGGDYKAEDIVGYREVTDNGGEVVTVPVVGTYSTSSIINKILHVYK